MFSRLYRSLGLVCSLMLMVGVVPAQAEQLRVAVASNFADTLEQLAQLFQAETGHELQLSAGSSGVHYTQIVNGAPFDLFFSADDERPQRLLQEHLASKVGVYALGRLLLWSDDADLVDAEGAVLHSGNYRRLAMANPAQAPYGTAAQEVLTTLGLWEAVQPKLVRGENIAQTLQFVASGNAELGFIAAAQYVALGKRGSVWEVPAQLHTPIRQSYAVLKDSPAARALVEFLNTDAARSLFERSGYSLP
jgi:molybdenum ABC transporter, periplasmic molybdate-binding protein